MSWAIDPILRVAGPDEPAPAGFQPAGERASASSRCRGCCWGCCRCWCRWRWSPWRAVLLAVGSVAAQGLRVSAPAVPGAARGRDPPRDRAVVGLHPVAADGRRDARPRACGSARRLPLPVPAASHLLVPVALFTMLTGLFLIIARRKAITQVLGYLVMENGIFTFGMALVARGAAAGGAGRAAGRLRGRVRHGHHRSPHQPRVRPHRLGPAVDA